MGKRSDFHRILAAAAAAGSLFLHLALASAAEASVCSPVSLKRSLRTLVDRATGAKSDEFFRTIDFSRTSWDFRKKSPAELKRQVARLGREIDRLAPDAYERVLTAAREVMAIPSGVGVKSVGHPNTSEFIGSDGFYGLNRVSLHPPREAAVLNEVLALPGGEPIDRKLEMIRSARVSSARKKLQSLFDFDLLRGSVNLVSADGRLALTDARVHSQADLAEKLAAKLKLGTYFTPEQEALLERFAAGIRLTRQDAYSGHNQKLLTLTLQEAGGNAVGIPATRNTIAQVIATRRYSAGNAGMGLWTPSSAVGNFTAATSLFPGLEKIYGKGATRDVFWVIKDHDRSYNLNPRIKVRVGWGQPDLDAMRVVVNNSVDESGKPIPMTLEALVPTGDKTKGPEAFFFKNVNGEWIPQHEFPFADGRKLPVEKACLQCHARREPFQEVLAPLPAKLLKYSGDTLRRAGGYHPEVIEHVLDYLNKPY